MIFKTMITMTFQNHLRITDDETLVQLEDTIEPENVQTVGKKKVSCDGK